MKTINIIKSIIAILILATTLNSCKKDDESPTPKMEMDLIKIGESTLSGIDAKVVVYSEKSFTTGLNTVYIKIMDTKTDKEITTGTLTTNPMMDMGTMMHSAPVEDKVSTNNNLGYFQTNIYYIMPGTSAQWSLNFSFTDGNNTATGNLGVDVVSSNPKRMLSTKIADDNDVSVFITLIDTGKFKEGLNDFELVLHKRETMMSFPAVSNYTIEIEPEMPSMGHGSTHNENPVHMNNGHYKGKVNFSMGGLWRVNLKLLKDGKEISSDQYFEIMI